MANKQTGYDFWRNILHSPKYVAAPMVDMSELSYRMLCRQHGAQLCYSPMLHSVQYFQDFLYRQDNFSTCSEDRPLIVQFCANDAETFVNAAWMVSSECDAVDLNLGCPQAIARKGYYGSFLQDDWDLIRSIVQKAAYDLPIPVTCKMRILPGHFNRSIEYAKMLEHAGCSVLTVHGRTREQKGHATGLASWEVIKEIKSNVHIPVIANGNVLSFEDVQECLKYTNADAVMSAEALLHNPALFSGANPPVWEIVNEYLQLAEKYKTPIRCVRCHLFKILYLCIYQDDEIQHILTEGSSFQDFYSVIPLLKKFPNRFSKPTELEIIDDIPSLDSMFETLNAFQSNESTFLSSENESEIPNNEMNPLTSSNVNSSVIDINENICQLSTNENIRDTAFSENGTTDSYLPIWVCHSRPRLAMHEKSRGCFSKYFDSTKEKSDKNEDNQNNQYLSKKQLRRNRHHDRVLAYMKDKRKRKKLRRKQKIAESRQQQEIDSEVSDMVDKKSNLTKKQQKMLINERLLAAQASAPKVCIDLGFASVMDKKELSRLSSQLRRLYGSNRHSLTPLHLYFCNFSPSDELYKICKSKNDGFESYIVEMTDDSPDDLFNSDDIVFLSPDSETVLETLDSSKVYVIGGIVDGTVKKDLSLNHAKSSSIKTARLPIKEYLVQYSNNPGTMVLTVNQVYDILLKYYETHDWVESLSAHVPPRKGYCAPTKGEDLSRRSDAQVNPSKKEEFSEHKSSENTLASES